jgi:hypothetical protein
MTSITSVEEAMTRRSHRPNRSAGNFRTQFMGEDRHKGEKPDLTQASPIAYLVEQGPADELRAHFHEADQFQIFVNGNGRMGAHGAAPGMGHFVGPFSGYGPIVAGEKGLAYMTLRNTYDPGAQFLPENLERIRAKRFSRREVTFQIPAPVDDAELLALREMMVSPLIETQPDGLTASSFMLAAGACVTGPNPAEGGGQFWLVMAGQMLDPAKGGQLQRLSIAFVRPNDPPYVAQAGSGGLHVVLMQFPLFQATETH